MANSDTGPRSNSVDQDFVAGFLAGEVQRRHVDSLKASGLLFPGGEDDPEAQDLEPGKGDSDDTVGDPLCSLCCSKLIGCLTDHPVCDTKLQCHTLPPHCKTHEPDCKHKPLPGYEPPKHASWFDRP